MPTPATDRAALVGACDRLAAAVPDPDKPAGVPGLDRAAIDPRRAIPACRAAHEAAPEDARIAYQLGRAYEAADRFREASEAFLKGARLGSGAAMVEIGINYHQGRGIGKDQQSGRRWFERAAAQGNRWAMHNLGLLYELADGVTRDPAEARRWYARAAALGQKESVLRLARLRKGRP